MKGDDGISLPKPVLKVPIPIFTSSIVLDLLKYLVSGIKKAISIEDQLVFVFCISGSVSFFTKRQVLVKIRNIALKCVIEAGMTVASQIS